MDPITLAGLAMAIGATMGAMIMGGIDPVGVFLSSPSSIILVVCGTIGATLASGSMGEATGFVKVMLKALMPPAEPDSEKTIQTVLEFADTARRDGLLALEESVATLDDEFLQRGVQMAVDGTDPEVVREVLETDIAATEDRHKVGVGFFDRCVGYAPAFGVAGTVIGLIDMLNNLDDPSALGPAIGVAFATTLWGVFLANYIFSPMANRLRTSSKQEIAYKNMVLEGVIAIQAGASPRAVADRLAAYLAPSARESIDGSKSA
ncbi:MAG: motility protein A [Acidimicrobiales bacterium]